MSPVRAVLGVLCLALGAWFLLGVFRSPEAESPARAFTTSRSCRDCHEQVYAEWEGSQHAISWTNPAVRALSDDFANQDCIDCHAPRPIFVSGIGERVLPRASRRVEGVDCIACHQLPETPDGEPGGVAGTVTNPRAACRPVEKPALANVEFCAGCHDQHKTVRQWRESEWPGRGEDCLSCHMPYRNGDPDQGRHHGCPGGNDLDLLKEAVALRAVREDGRWVVEVENVGAGHSFPTDERSRAADVFWRPVPPGGDAGGPDGAPRRAGVLDRSWRHLHRFRSPYRHEVHLEDTLLAAHETRRVPIEDPAADGPVEVALFYKRSPYWEDPEDPEPEREATLVHSLVAAP